ncbi:MAG: hypothetical protein B7Z78_02075 [Rhodospirillales bacterium 20-60-12]|nr:MAG: hypothetical protein B7Z78_02075 [Rhodospirillales bacterium 20-60-12]HQU01246.1 hypothetical protein [Acetobacteraceae bacterium]
MMTHFRLRPMFIAGRLGAGAVLLAGLAACAPTNTNTTYSTAAIGQTGYVTYGQILSERPVAVVGQGGGIGTLAGGAVGATAGSFIGGPGGGAVNVLGAIGGAIVGGLVGNAVGTSATSGQAVEFIIRQDDGTTISVVQTNELQLQPGDRVQIIRGNRTRLARAG